MAPVNRPLIGLAVICKQSAAHWSAGVRIEGLRRLSRGRRMVSISPAGALAACAVAATAICGAGVLTGVVQAPAGVTLFAPAAKPPLDWPEAVRLAKQTSFGPTAPLVAHLVDAGVDGWLDEQFAARGSTYADLAALA